MYFSFERMLLTVEMLHLVLPRSEHSVLGELLCDAVVGHSLKEKLVDAPDGNGLLRIDDQIAVSAFVITEEPLVG